MHPAWTPKQNLTRSLEGVLTSFLDEAHGAGRRWESGGKRKPLRTGVKTEGVWIGCRGSSEQEQGSFDSEKRVTVPDECEEIVDEEDEMIWWAWDGKIVGFSDW